MFTWDLLPPPPPLPPQPFLSTYFQSADVCPYSARTAWRPDLPLQGGWGLVPAIPPEKYLTPQKTIRNIRPPNRPDYIVQNPVHNQSRNHDRCLEIPSYNTEQYKQSFFPRTIIAWNKLNTSIVQASSLEAFKSALAVVRRRWGAPTPRTQPRRNLRQTTDITKRRKTLWRLKTNKAVLLLLLPFHNQHQYLDDSIALGRLP